MPVLDWLQGMLGGAPGETPATPPSASGGWVPDALQQLGGYLSNSAHNLSRIPGDIGRQVALPYLQQQEKLYTADWSKEPLMGVGEGGELTGRIPALASWATQGMAGGAPGGAGVMSSGLRWGGPPIRAYHGSPHQFAPEPGAPYGRFRNDRIGEGEGAQAYGYGMPYLAEAEPVAKGYRDNLSRHLAQDPNFWKNVELPEPLIGRDRNLYYALSGQMRKEGNLPPDQMQQWRVLHEKKQAYDAAVEAAKPKGHMYEVDIHADPNRFLDWDKTLAQQPDMAALLEKKRIPGFDPDITGRELYGRASEVFGGEAGASRVLQKSGVAGTRYLDELSRANISGLGKLISDVERRIGYAEEVKAPPAARQKLADELAGYRRQLQSGTSNYAMFDPKLVEILRRYGILGPTAATGLLGAAADE